jgi:hypothetical protein
MKQMPFEFSRCGWIGQRPMTRQELKDKKRRIRAKARALRVAAMPPGGRGKEQAE